MNRKNSQFTSEYFHLENIELILIILNKRPYKDLLKTMEFPIYSFNFMDRRIVIQKRFSFFFSAIISPII